VQPGRPAKARCDDARIEATEHLSTAAETNERALLASPSARLLGGARVTRRGIQIALGVIWLIDGLLQFQSYMYSHAFVTGVLEASAAGQPSFIHDSIFTFARFYSHDITLWNTLAAEIQCAIGLGLIVSRRTVRAALVVSLFWCAVVWWFGEGFAGIFGSSPVSPLMGAPGAVLLYGVIGLLVWPRSADGDESEALDGGLLGRYGGRAVWTLLWIEAGVLWLLSVNRSRNSIHDQIAGMAAAAPAWLAGAMKSLANTTQGHGVLIATILGVASFVIALVVWTPGRPAVLVLGAMLSLGYWVFGQSLGGPFWGGAATDLGSGPLIVLLAVAVLGEPSAPPLREPAAATRSGSRVVAT
jgi:hypothetical protein